tara:strand:+ start:1028 stop:1402 length:375 start_codon:yes stop_codon:yes gene_type:complete
MRICLDLDGVICQLKKSGESYSDLKPVPGAVEKIKKLKSSGNYIIIFTARRMKTHSSNKGKLLKDIGKITLDWLEDNKIIYDEIYFGKPWAHIYIDDNGYRFNNWDDISHDCLTLPANKELSIK